MSVWDSLFDSFPIGDGKPKVDRAKIGETALQLRARMEKDHIWNVSESTDGFHSQGSGRSYYGTTTPTKRPDGSTSLSADDNGRIWADTNDNSVKSYVHPDFLLMRCNHAPCERITILRADAWASGVEIDTSWTAIPLYDSSGTISDISLDAVNYQISVPAGTYYCTFGGWVAIANWKGQLRLRDVTNGTTLGLTNAIDMFGSIGYGALFWIDWFTQFTLTGTVLIEFQGIRSNKQLYDPWGADMGGVDPLGAYVYLWKLS